MNNNNWHVPIQKFNDEQRAIIERVYGSGRRYLNNLHDCKWVSNDREGENITPDEAFAILGLDKLLDIPSDVGIKRYKETIARLEQENIELNCQGEVAAHELCEAEQKIKDLEQQLASQSEKGFHGVNWSTLGDWCKYVARDKEVLKEPDFAGEPEQGLQNVDWDKLADGSATGLAQFSDGQVLPIKQMQNGKNARWVHSVRLIQEWIEHNYNPVKILATRPKPKPKYNAEQLEAVKAFAEWVKDNQFDNGKLLDMWLKEQE